MGSSGERSRRSCGRRCASPPLSKLSHAPSRGPEARRALCAGRAGARRRASRIGRGRTGQCPTTPPPPRPRRKPIDPFCCTAPRALARVQARAAQAELVAHEGALGAAALRVALRRVRERLSPVLRTNRTRRVLHPVLIGHAASLTQACSSRARSRRRMCAARAGAPPLPGGSPLRGRARSRGGRRPRRRLRRRTLRGTQILQARQGPRLSPRARWCGLLSGALEEGVCGVNVT